VYSKMEGQPVCVRKNTIMSQRKKNWKKVVSVFVGVSGVMLNRCEDNPSGGKGNLSVLIEPEGVIINGLVPGNEVINIRDGWTIYFDKYLTAVGGIVLRNIADDSVEASALDTYVLDLNKIPASGLPVWQFDDLASGRWNISYNTPVVTSTTRIHETVLLEDYHQMVANGWTYLVDGVMTKVDGQSCPPRELATPGDLLPNGQMSGNNPCYDAPTLRIKLGAEVATVYGPCEIDHLAGAVVPVGGTQTVAVTLHGDHLFFNGFPAGSEGGVTRLAQWIADCDLNLDGEVTNNELLAITPAALPEIDERYQLGGSPLTPLYTMYDYFKAQLKTQGHFQGEGECPADGKWLDHGHSHDLMLMGY